MPDDSFHNPEQLKLEQSRGRCHQSLQKTNTEHALYLGVHTRCNDVRTLYICVYMDALYTICMGRVIPGSKIRHETREKTSQDKGGRHQSPLERGGGGGGGG